MSLTPGPRRSLGKEMATLSSVLAWKAPWTEEHSGLHCSPWGHKESNTTEHVHTHTHTHTHNCVYGTQFIPSRQQACFKEPFHFLYILTSMLFSLVYLLFWDILGQDLKTQGISTHMFGYLFVNKPNVSLFQFLTCLFLDSLWNSNSEFW